MPGGRHCARPYGKVSLIVALLLFLSSGCSHPELVERGDRAPEAKKCGECHIEIHKEWQGSPHAKSFSNEEFREATNDYQFGFCLGCHAPETVYTEGEPALRKVRPEEGVTCNSCHLTEDCRLAGPHKSRAPHPVSQSHEFYKRSELCAKCHLRTYQEWKEVPGDDKKSCPDCHMPGLRRKLIQDEPWQRLFKNREIKRHTFSISEELLRTEEPVKIWLKEISTDGPLLKGTVLLVNKVVPHSIPTGDYGYREAVARLGLADNQGNTHLLKEEPMFEEKKTALKYGEERTIGFSIPLENRGKGSRLVVEFLRRSFEGKTLTLLARRDFPLD